MSGERPRFERQDIQPGAVVRGGIVVALLTALGAGGAYLAFRAIKGGPPEATVATPPLPPEPRLQTNEVADLDAVLRGQRERLGSYGWVAPAAGIVHIPIDQAMRRVMEEGFPVRETGPEIEAAPVPTDSGGMR